MNSRLRRSLVLTTLLTLVLGVSGAAAPIALARSPTDTRVAGIDIDATTIPELQELMDAHRLKSVQLTQFYLHRIRKLNPTLNAVITVSPTALADARAADAARRRGDDRPLLGIPIIVKDNINTTGMATTAGSWALAGSTPDDAFIVQQLKAAGALVIGKANLSEWANFRSGPSSTGWSGIGGQTNMAYVLDRNPCGSSSGSGVVASADLAVAAVGTETDGSIVCPSGANGVVGIKPTLGLLEPGGRRPDQRRPGHRRPDGPQRDRRCGAPRRPDRRRLRRPGHGRPGRQRLHRLHAVPGRQALNGARIGVWRAGSFEVEGLPVDEYVSAILADTIAALEAEGATVIDPADIDLSATGPAPSSRHSSASSRPTSPRTSRPTSRAPTRSPARTTRRPCRACSHSTRLIRSSKARMEQRSSSSSPRRRAGATPTAPISERVATPPPRRRSIRSMADNDLDAIIALTNGPAWITTRSRGWRPRRRWLREVRRLVRPPRPRPATRISRCPRASTDRSRSASRSSAAPGMSRR